MNKSIHVGQKTSRNKSAIWVGVVQALLLTFIAAAFAWNQTRASTLMTPFASFMSIAPVYAMIVVVPVSVANIILIVRQRDRVRTSVMRMLLLGLSLVLSIGVVATTIWIGFLLIGLINAANQANSV